MKEIVIKMSEVDYERFLKNRYSPSACVAIYNAIKNGKVLPKGHGEWVTVNTPEDYPKESGDYLIVLKDTAFHDFEYTDITSFDCDGILAEWDLKPQYKVVAWKYFEPYKGDTE